MVIGYCMDSAIDIPLDSQTLQKTKLPSCKDIPVNSAGHPCILLWSCPIMNISLYIYIYMPKDFLWIFLCMDGV